MTFTALVVSHQNERGLRGILGQLRYQTRPPDETIVLCSDTPDLPRLREHFPEARFVEQPNRSDWGHEKRSIGLGLATGDWLGFFNDDDSYSRDYIEKMLAHAGTSDVVYCGWNEQPECVFQPGSSTAGNFITKTLLAKQVGWRHRHYEADGMFIDGLRSAGATVVKHPDVLYFHNQETQ